jgi:hypothetical protein
MECFAFCLPCCVITKNGRKSFSSKSWFRRNLLLALLLFIALLGVLLFFLCFLKPCAAFQTIVEKELDLIVLLDESNSMNLPTWKEEQEVAGLLMSEVQKRFTSNDTGTHPDGSPKSIGRFGASVVQYASGPQYIHQNYTTDISKVVDSLSNSTFPRICDGGEDGAQPGASCGCTWYATALAECVDQIELYGWKSDNSFKICAFFSDGINNDPGSDISYIGGDTRSCVRDEAYSQEYMTHYSDQWKEPLYAPIPTTKNDYMYNTPATFTATVPSGYSNEPNFTNTYAKRVCSGAPACAGIIGPDLPSFYATVPVCDPVTLDCTGVTFPAAGTSFRPNGDAVLLVGQTTYPILPKPLGEPAQQVFQSGTTLSNLTLPASWYDAGSQTSAFCSKRQIPAVNCTARGIEAYAKFIGVKILGFYVSDAADTVTGSENMQHFASCDWEWGAEQPPGIDNCTYFARAANFDELREKIKSIAEALVDRIDSGSGGIICLGSGFCILFLLLLCPLITYLLYRPATLIAAAYRRKHRKDQPQQPPPAGAGAGGMNMQATMSAEQGGPSQGQQQPPPGGNRNPGPAPGQQPGGGGANPGDPGNGKWGKVNTDQYLWNFGGGVTPMNVQFGENAYVPSAMHLQSVQLQERHQFGDGEWFAPPAAACKSEYAEDECQPGDLDYEYTRFWYGLAPSLNPNREAEIALNEGKGGGCFQPSGCCGCMHMCCPCLNKGVPSEQREVVRTTRDEQKARYEADKAAAAVKTVPQEGAVVNPMAAKGEERRMSWRRKGDSSRDLKKKDEKERSTSFAGRMRGASKSGKKEKKKGMEKENSWRRGGIEMPENPSGSGRTLSTANEI